MLLTAGLLRRLRCRCTLLADGDLASASAAAAAAHSTHAAASTHHAAPPRALAMRLATPRAVSARQDSNACSFPLAASPHSEIAGTRFSPAETPRSVRSPPAARIGPRYGKNAGGAGSSPPVNLQVGVGVWECAVCELGGKRAEETGRPPCRLCATRRGFCRFRAFSVLDSFDETALPLLHDSRIIVRRTAWTRAVTLPCGARCEGKDQLEVYGTGACKSTLMTSCAAF